MGGRVFSDGSVNPLHVIIWAGAIAGAIRIFVI